MTTDKMVVHKSRDNEYSFQLGMDVSTETLTSQIRTTPDEDGELLAEFDITLVTDGTDGEVILSLPRAEIADVNVRQGYMDIKRETTGGKWLPMFDKPVEVEFRGVVTV